MIKNWLLFFFSINQKYSCLILTTPSFKSLCTREVWLIGREQLRKLGREGSDVIQSRQQKQLRYFSMRQVSSWKVFAIVFLRIRSKFELNSSVTRVCQLVVVLCRIATTVQTREKEFLYIILFPAAVFYQVRRDSCPHIARTSTQPAVLLFAPSISLMTVLPGLIMWEHPWNALYRAQFPQYGRKHWKRYTFLSLLRFNISLLH